MSSNLTLAAIGEKLLRSMVLRVAPNYVAEGSIPFLPAKFKVAGVAQLVEQWFCNPKVMGSSPFTSTIFLGRWLIGLSTRLLILGDRFDSCTSYQTYPTVRNNASMHVIKLHSKTWKLFLDKSLKFCSIKYVAIKQILW